MAHCCTAAIGTFGRAVLCCARERRKEMNVTHKLIAVPVSPAAHVTLQRLERRLLDAVAVDRPPDDLLGVGKDLAGMEMGLFGLGDGVASGKSPVFGDRMGMVMREEGLRPDIWWWWW